MSKRPEFSAIGRVHFVYVLRLTKDNEVGYYVGYSSDLNTRMMAHCNSYSRMGVHVQLCGLISAASKIGALFIESKIQEYIRNYGTAVIKELVTGLDGSWSD